MPGDPERNASFRKAIGTIWGIGAGVTVLAVAGRLHLWGLNEFGLVFMGIYDGLAIAFLTSAYNFSTIGRGVSFGAHRPNQT